MANELQTGIFIQIAFHDFADRSDMVTECYMCFRH